MEDLMRCNTCQGAVRFQDGEWVHAVAAKCAAVVVEWPERPLVDEDEAA